MKKWNKNSSNSNSESCYRYRFLAAFPRNLIQNIWSDLLLSEEERNIPAIDQWKLLLLYHGERLMHDYVIELSKEYTLDEGVPNYSGSMFRAFYLSLINLGRNINK